jgi:two-component system phosphate regulon response regulator PhoB
VGRILVVEDEPALQRVLEYNLRQAGHDVTVTGTARAAIASAHEAPPDLALVDLMLPDVAGTEVLRDFSRTPSLRTVPVIVVSAKGDEVDRIVGFEMGAADYIVKPFSVRELLLRVQAVLRRARGATQEDQRRIVGRLRIDEQAHRVWVDDKEIELTLLEYRLLLAFVTQEGRALPRGTLLDGVWGLDVSITSRTVDTHINRLRDKLGAAAAYIETVRGVGYRFLVREAGETSPAD